MNTTPTEAHRTDNTRMPVAEKIIWACGAVAILAGLVLAPLTAGTAQAMVTPLVIAALTILGAVLLRHQRLGAQRQTGSADPGGVGG